ncbi:MAG: hypothetical protein MUP47_03675, partial [Phycisphaerae bacterium]|nr:hypothetical protein [Phycisphaerae bacterium]
RDAAIEEMTRGGYGFHRAWAGLVDVVRGLPVEDIRRRLSAADLAASRPASRSTMGTREIGVP